MRTRTVVSLLVPAAIDAIVTLLGQPASYWFNYSTVHEGSPGGYALLSIHPLVFILVFLLYLAGSAYILKRWRNAYTLVFGIALFTGHAWGSSSWIPIFFHGADWYAYIAYFIFLSIPLGISLNRELYRTDHVHNSS